MKGVGFGNIFGSGPIKLRPSSGVWKGEPEENKVNTFLFREFFHGGGMLFFVFVFFLHLHLQYLNIICLLFNIYHNIKLPKSKETDGLLTIS